MATQPVNAVELECSKIPPAINKTHSIKFFKFSKIDLSNFLDW